MLTARQQHCLQGIGVTQWKIRPSGIQIPDEATVEKSTPLRVSTPPPAPAKPESHPPAIEHKTFDVSDWPQTLQAIENCANCSLAQSCTRKVPGKGFQQADLMIIGEAPGHEEDLQGRPFVGRAGKLLDRMLMAIDLEPDKVYITNILKCRPPNNRDPKTEEVEACSLFLKAQINLIQPKVIFSVGRISAQNLLKDKSPVGQLRGTQHTLPDTDIPLLVTYHPAYLLRNPAEKIKVWQDLKVLRKILQHASD